MPEPGREHVLIAGVTTRPFAVSAARAGYRVTAIDAFGDLDLRAVAEVIVARPRTPGEPYGPLQAADAGRLIPAGLTAYTSNFENYPQAVTRLAAGRRLLGNPPDTLAQVRNPMAVARTLRRHGLTGPETRSRPPEGRGSRAAWLLKPRRSGGGHGVSQWRRGTRVPGTMYLQQRIDGTPGSVSFAADGSNAVILGFSRQLVADPRLGARRFRYCGSILGHSGIRLFPRQKELLERVAEIVATVTQAFRLVGLNGIDFIARRGIPFPIEVNPRYSASMELIERAHNLSMFQIHAQACDGLLPQITEQGKPQVHGKAIVFAREESVIAANSSWSSCGWMADIPHPGERIQQGRPVCTVFASARSPEACRRLLWRKADAVYRKLKWPRKRAA